jgi:hypothetical protein
VTQIVVLAAYFTTKFSWQTYRCARILSPWIFVLGNVATAGFSALTVGSQAFRAATQDPVDTLLYA